MVVFLSKLYINSCWCKTFYELRFTYIKNRENISVLLARSFQKSYYANKRKIVIGYVTLISQTFYAM